MSTGARHRPSQGPVAPSAEALKAYSQQWKQKERRDYRKEDKRVMEELVPKETGHDAKVAAKHARAADRRAREQSPEVRQPGYGPAHPS